jgi:hypothetical protein
MKPCQLDEAMESTLYTIADRSAGKVDVPIATFDQTDLTKLHTYLVFAQPPALRAGETGQVSSTAYLAVPSP